jgi:ecotin
MKTLLLLLTCLWLSFLHAEDLPELEPFPEPGQGMIRAVIVLEERPNEEEFQVELLVGQMIKTDVVNIRRMGGEIRERPVKGWGYTYYEAERGPVFSTMMAPPPGSEDTEKFITMPGKMIRYNSKLPIVVHVPKMMEVRYRIWQAGPQQKARVMP